MHEIIHCFPFCNNHGKEFKKYASYINQQLGYDISRAGNKQEDYLKSNLEYKDDSIESYKYIIKCKNCNQIVYRKRFNVKQIGRYRCAKCNGMLEISEIKRT
jgi:predicted SprT family Zn-dependent metalloprotease